MVIETERAEIEARAKVTERVGRCGSTARRPPGLAAVALGLRRRLARATAATTWWRSPATRTSRSRRPRRSPGSVRAGRRTGRRPSAAGMRATTAAPAPGRRPRTSTAEDRALMTRDRRQAPAPQRMGFFTDTTMCIGCKACEVACKQWNDLPADGGDSAGGSYDYTGALSGDTWRHVRFVELAAREEVDLVAIAEKRAVRTEAAFDLGLHVRRLQALHERRLPRRVPDRRADPHRVRTVVLQPDVCNGCGYCVPACPFGVVDRDPTTAAPPSARSATTGSRTGWSRRARRRARPTRSSSAPTTSSRGAERRVAALHARGVEGAYLYGAGDAQTSRSRAASARSSCSPSRPSASGCRRRPTRRSRRTSSPARLAAVGGGGARRGEACRRVPEGGGAMGDRARRDARGRQAARRRLGEPPRRGRSSTAATRGRRWSSSTARTRDTPARVPDRGVVRPRAARAGRRAGEVNGPVINAPVWTWEVPLYFCFGGMAAGSSFVALACDPAGDERSAAVARKVTLGALPVAAAADHRPRAARALLQHAAHLQAALADVDGRVGADRVRQPGRGRGRRRPARPPPRARALGAANAVVGGYLGSYTGVLLASTAVPRVGALAARSSARSSSAPRRRPARPPTGWRSSAPAAGGHPTRARSARSRPSRWPRSSSCRGQRAPARPARGRLEHGRPGAFTAAKWAVRGGLALRFARRGRPRPTTSPARSTCARAGVPLRVGRGPGRSRRSDDRVVGQMIFFFFFFFFFFF